MMGKRWTPEEKKIMSDFYPTDRPVQEIADMLGRPVQGVLKKGAAMGLKRPDLHEVALSKLESVLDDTPRSSSEIADLLGMTRSATCSLLSRAHDEGLCHVAGFRETLGRGSDASLWVVGFGENAVSDFAAERAEREAKLAEHAAKPFKAFRDPLVEAFFGRAA
jgi:predicted DNA-binding protein YlxM (UPF0122 family)